MEHTGTQVGQGHPRRCSTRSPEVMRALARYSQYQGGHTDQWGRFTVHSPDFASASQLAAELGWWLHCWTYRHCPQGELRIEENEPPGQRGWQEEPLDLSQ